MDSGVNPTMAAAACLLMPCCRSLQNFCCLAGVSLDGLPGLPGFFLRGGMVLLLVLVLCVCVAVGALLLCTGPVQLYSVHVVFSKCRPCGGL